MKAKETVKTIIEGPKPSMEKPLAGVILGESNRKHHHKLKGDVLLRTGLNLIANEDDAQDENEKARKEAQDANARLIQTEGVLLVARFNLGEFVFESKNWTKEQRRVFVEQGFKAHPFEEYSKKVKGAPKGYDESRAIGTHVMACCLGVSQSRVARSIAVYNAVKTRKSLARKVENCVSSEKIIAQNKGKSRKKSADTQNIRLEKDCNKVLLSHIAPIILNNIENESRQVKEVGRELAKALQKLG